jgi:glycosyltransferase involved in cell wall biosynthesis
MRILQVHNRYRDPGGEDSVVAAEADLLRGAGHDVFPYQIENPVGRAAAAGNLALAPWNPAAARRLVDFAADVVPDVAHVHNTWFSLSPSVLRGLDRAGTPVVMTLHNHRLMCANAALFRDGRPCQLCVGTHPWHGVRHRCYHDSFAASAAAATTIALNRAVHTWSRHVALFLALTRFAAERFVAGGLPAERIEVKPNFVADPGGRPRPPSSSDTVLFVGRLYEPKGISELIDVWEAVAPARLELVVVGDGPLRTALERRAVPSVRLVGELPHASVLALMHDARALVFPSHLYEGQPMAILEALAAGLPVLASRHGGMAATLQDAAPGTLIDVADRGAWGEALTRLTDDDAVDGAGSTARSLYEARFTPELALGRLDDAYRRACGLR